MVKIILRVLKILFILFLFLIGTTLFLSFASPTLEKRVYDEDSTDEEEYDTDIE